MSGIWPLFPDSSSLNALPSGIWAPFPDESPVYDAPIRDFLCFSGRILHVIASILPSYVIASISPHTSLRAKRGNLHDDVYEVTDEVAEAYAKKSYKKDKTYKIQKKLL
jgi:hypothetical protein